MTRKPSLSLEDISRAKQYVREGKSNREIALIFGVGKTTIWDNIYARSKRIRIYVPAKKKDPDLRPACIECGIKLTRDVRVHHPSPVSIYQVPANFKMGNRCLGCYLREKGITHMDLVNS